MNDPADTSCTFRTANQPVDQPLPINAVARGFTAQVPSGAIVTCQMINRAPPAPDIDIEKATNGADADAEPGPFVPIGDPVTWTYTITNTGNVTINGITISDTVGTALPVPVTGCATSLAPGDSDTCEVTGVAVAGQYSNVGSVRGTPTVGPVQTDTDPSHYFGAEAAIDIVKTTNTDDANFAPGPIIPVGGDVTWDYVVTNIGDTIINDIEVTDSDPEVTVVCTPGVTSLDPDEVLECSATGTAEAGQYENIATVTGTDELDVDVQADDPSHYFGEQASVTLEKYTGTDPADTATGPLFSVGDTVTWIYEITNTGNVPVTYQLTDNPAPAIGIACTRLLFIQPGQTIFCHASAPAEAGQHQNVASVVATAPSGPLLPVTDPANYFGVQGGIDIEKLTNGEDADEPPGPYVLVGSTVNWTYVVTNTGNSPLTGIVVTDNKGVAVTCPSGTLPSGPPPTNSMTCTGSAAALEDQYTNLASVVGATPLGILVRDEDPSNYFGGVPDIDLQKHTNGIDADEPTGVFIPEGGDVEWTYTVTNTGSATLSDLAVTDDQGVTVTCPETTIASGDEVICTAPIAAAELGQYSNTATATATSQVGDVSPPIRRTTSGSSLRSTSRSSSTATTPIPRPASSWRLATRSPGRTRSRTPATSSSATSPSSTTRASFRSSSTATTETSSSSRARFGPMTRLVRPPGPAREHRHRERPRPARGAGDRYRPGELHDRRGPARRDGDDRRHGLERPQCRRRPGWRRAGDRRRARRRDG